MLIFVTEMTTKILIKNIRQLAMVYDDAPRKLSGKDMNAVPVLDDAWLAIENGIIADYGIMTEFPGITDWNELEIIDANEGMVLPAFVDSHTHLVYAGSREGEFVDRINGLSYEEIASRGGGILNSAAKLRATSEDDLYAQAAVRLQEVMRLGTGAIEIKSGYGLDLESELKMLRVIRRLKENFTINIKSTFLGAHAVPLEFKDNKPEYIKYLIEVMLPAVAHQNLADYCDVFCERNYFTEEETVQILEAAQRLGVKPRVHANQLSASGGVQAGVRVNALSVDHLEFVGDEEISALKNSNTMPTLLPGAAFFLSLPWPPARKMIDAGLPVAIASDFNPGSSPSGNMMQMMSMACIAQKMTPNEVLNATTINTAYAIELSETHGTITRGKVASVIITKAVPSLAYLPYYFGSNLIETVIINGSKVN